MKPDEKWVSKFSNVLPSPFSIAVILTFLAFLLAFIFTENDSFTLINYWRSGFWNNGLLVFLVQMMLMLVLGHALALTPTFSKITNIIVLRCNSTASAAYWVSLSAIVISLLNWGLGLIFGAILARKAGGYAKQKQLKINYPLIGAAGYSGLMVWHGGFSGSAPLKVAESGHFLENSIGIIGLNQTLFSPLNLLVTSLVILIIPTFFFVIGKKVKPKAYSFESNHEGSSEIKEEKLGAEKMDGYQWFSVMMGLFLLFAVLNESIQSEVSIYNLITPNFINLILFGLCLCLHQNTGSFLNAVNKAIVGSSGILIQFPIYFGIMGVMNSSGLISDFSTFLVSVSNETSFPLLTFVSAGVVNIFIPSGGGQWAVQGSLIAETSQQLGIPIGKSIMAMAYGDQLTNMLQPFWALPLLGITQLKGKEILPYSFLIMLIGTAIFTIGLLVF